MVSYIFLNMILFFLKCVYHAYKYIFNHTSVMFKLQFSTYKIDKENVYFSL